MITCVVKYLFDRINDGEVNLHVVGEDSGLLGLEGPFTAFFCWDCQVHESAIIGGVEFEIDGVVLDADLRHEAQAGNGTDVDRRVEWRVSLHIEVFSRGTIVFFCDGDHFSVET